MQPWLKTIFSSNFLSEKISRLKSTIIGYGTDTQRSRCDRAIRTNSEDKNCLINELYVVRADLKHTLCLIMLVIIANDFKAISSSLTLDIIYGKFNCFLRCFMRYITVPGCCKNYKHCISELLIF